MQVSAFCLPAPFLHARMSVTKSAVYCDIQCIEDSLYSAETGRERSVYSSDQIQKTVADSQRELQTDVRNPALHIHIPAAPPERFTPLTACWKSAPPGGDTAPY